MKGMKPGSKPDKGKGSDQTEQLLRIIDVQSRVIEALATAVVAVEGGEEEGEEDENDEDKEKEGE